MASRKEYDMMFQLNAQLGGSYNSTFKSATSAVAAMQKEIEALSRSQSDIAAYQKQQSAIEATKKKLEVLQQQYDNIQKEMSETEKYSSALQNKLLSKQQQIDKSNASIAAQTEKLGQMGAALRSAGIDTNNLGKESAQLGVKLDEVKRKQEEAAEKSNRFGAAASQAFATVQQAIVAAGIAKALQEIYEYFMACSDASMQFESVLTGVDKTTELTNKELADMGKAFKELSTKDIPATTTELGTIAETAGQLGIAKGNLLDFTEIMAMLGTATNMTSDEAATMLAQFTSITGMDPKLYSNLGSAIVALGNNYATTERNIAEMSQTIAAAGSISEMSEADIVGISAAVTSLGISAQNGGTQMTKLISDINSAVSSGDDLDAWAAVARMSADDFATAWGSNAAGALDLFIRGLNETYRSGQDVYGVLRDLGITETRMVTMMTSLAKSGDRLTGTLSTANAAWRENTALVTEAEKRYSNTQSQLVFKQNAYNNLKVAIGDAYTPALKEAYKVETDVMNGMAQFIADNPTLVRAVTAAAIVLGTVTAALAAYTIGAKLAAIASAALSAAIPGVNVIMAVTAGVALLAAGITALAGATDQEAKEVRQLTESSRAQYFQLQELNVEYKHAIEAYGESSDEARRLRWQIEDLSAEYEFSKRSVADFAKEIEASVQANAELIQGYRSAADEIDKQEYNVTTLINRLSELISQNDQTAASQEQIRATVDALNQVLPELSLNYEDIIANGADMIETIKAIAKVEADKQRYQENYAAYINLLSKSTELERDAANALTEKESAQKRYNDASEAYWDMLQLMTKHDTSGMAGIGAMYSTEYKELQAAEEALKTYTKAHDSASEAIRQNQAAQEDALGVMREYVGVEGEATEGNKALQRALSDTKLKIEDLIDAYNEAYNAALQSVQGQYDLWDRAAQVVATDADTINNALKSQAIYWESYNANLASLSERSADIEGLREVIASFADGSKDSVNAIAGMAKASDADLMTMVVSWKKLQDEQKTVADSLAELETDFTTSMDNLQKELEATVAEMNLGQEAAQAGISTVQGFIDGATDMLPKVEAAYGRIAKAASDALSLKIQYSASVQESARVVDGSHADGLDYVPYDGYIAELHKGERILTAEEAQVVMFAPQLMAALNSYRAFNAVSATSSGRENGSSDGSSLPPIHIHFDINGSISDGTVESLRQYGNEFAERVLHVIEEYNIDAARRSYR